MEKFQKGFSLIELLVVLAILTILMGLVVPKVGRMMDEAKEHKCRNNLRQLHTAVINHANDKSGKLPVAMSYEWFDPVSDQYIESRGWVSWQPPGNKFKGRWPNKVSQENGMVEDGGMDEPSKYGAAQFGIENGSLYVYMNASMEHYACPLIKKGKGSEVFRTYAMNGFFNSPRRPSDTPRYLTRIGTSESYLGYKPEAAKLLLFAEVEPTLATHKHAGADPATSAGSDKRATDTISGDCCIAPPLDSSTTDIIYSAHRSPIADKQASLAVFLDGHIEKVFSLNSDGKNAAWFYTRGLAPEEPLPN